MADQLNIQIKADVSAAINNLKKLEEELQKIRDAMAAAVSSAQDLSASFKTMGESAKAATKHIEELRKAIAKLKGKNVEVKTTYKSVGKPPQTPAVGKSTTETTTGGASDGGTVSVPSRTVTETTTSNANNLSKALEKLKKSLAGATGHSSKFLATLGRLAKVMLIRRAIMALFRAVGEGVKNLYQYSAAMNSLDQTHAKQTLDSLASSWMQVKNTVGVLAMNLINTLKPVLDWLMNAFTTLLNVINAVMAALGGSGVYTKAVRTNEEFAKSASSAAGSAKELQRTLLGFDEINRLNGNSGGGGGGGGASATDYAKMFTESMIPEWLQNLATSLKLGFKDIFFDWEDMNAEKILQKLIVGLGAICGGYIGWKVGGLGGAVVGAVIGAGVTAVISSLFFNHDGVLSMGELNRLIVPALTGLCGGIIGFAVGGIPGALVGATIGFSLSMLLGGIANATSSVSLSKSQLFQKLQGALLGALAGGIIGGLFMGPAGALLGATVGIVISLIVTSVDWSNVTATLGAIFTGGNKTTKQHVQELSDLGLYASGGFPDAGSVFVAGEAGAEFVGNIGGKTGVMNTDQMSQSVAEGNAGVIAALESLISAVNSKNVDVILDGKSLASGVSRYQRNSARAFG